MFTVYIKSAGTKKYFTEFVWDMDYEEVFQ